MTPDRQRHSRRFGRGLAAVAAALAMLAGAFVASAPANADGSSIVWRGEDTTYRQVGLDYSDDAGAAFATFYELTVGSLPTGLSLDGNSGVVSGIPTVDGTWTFTTVASNEAGSVSRVRTIVIEPVPTPEPTTTATPEPTDSPTPTPTPTPTATPTTTPTPTPTPTPTATPTPTPTATPQPAPLPVLDPYTPLLNNRPPANSTVNTINSSITSAAPNSVTAPLGVSVVDGKIVFGASPDDVFGRPVPNLLSNDPLLNGSLGVDGILATQAKVIMAPLPRGLMFTVPVFVNASALKPGAGYGLVVHSSPVTLASGVIDATGALSIQTVLPAELEPGLHRLVLTAVGADGSPVTVTQWFSITVDGLIGEASFTGPVADPTAVSELARTGANPVGGLWAALLALGGGLALVVLGTRRRSPRLAAVRAAVPRPGRPSPAARG